MRNRGLAILLLLLAILLLGGAIFLYFWDIPAPQQVVEKTIPDDQLPH